MPSYSPMWFAREQLEEDIRRSLSQSSTRSRAGGVVLLGPPTSGKTTLLTRALANPTSFFSLYVDLARISMTPESFAVEFLCCAARQFLSSDSSHVSVAGGIDFLIGLKDKLPDGAYDVVLHVRDELLKIKPDQARLVQSAFSFASELEKKRNVVVGLDNIERLLLFENFKGIDDVVALVDGRAKNVTIIGASSFAHGVTSRFTFDVVPVPYFSFDEVKVFLKKHGVSAKDDVALVHRLSSGSPYVLRHILEKHGLSTSKKGFSVSHVVHDFLDPHSLVHSYCEKLFSHARYNTSGQTLIEVVLNTVACHAGLRLSEIARRIYRSAPVTKSLIERLLVSGILRKENNRYYFVNSALGTWLRLRVHGYLSNDSSEITDEKIKEVLALL